MRRISPVIAAAVGALFVAQPAIAESVVVTYNDLDLSTAHGQRELQHRIDKAARKVCGMDQVTTGTRIQSSQAKKCLKDTKQQIEQKLAAVIDKSKDGG